MPCNSDHERVTKTLAVERALAKLSDEERTSLGYKQMGAVLVFKPGVPLIDARAALETLQNLLEVRPCIKSFNPEHGGPVWYIP